MEEDDEFKPRKKAQRNDMPFAPAVSPQRSEGIPEVEEVQTESLVGQGIFNNKGAADMLERAFVNQEGKQVMIDDF